MKTVARNTKKFHGVIPPVVTPLDSQGNFDRRSFENVINHLIEGGVDGLFILGSTSAVVFLTDKQREEVIKAAVEINAGRLPILCGVIDTQTNRVIDHIRIAEKYNVDGIVATAPFYALDDEAVVENHFRLLRKATKLPIFAYDLPVCVHKKLSFEMLVRLGKDGVLDGVKDSSGDDVSFRYLMLENEEAGHPLACFSGHEIVVDGILLGGADGFVPGLGNVCPKLYADMWKASQVGNWDEVKTLQDKAARIFRIVTCKKETSGFGSGIGGFLTALELMGIVKTHKLPDPSFTLGDKDVAQVEKILKDEGII